MGADTSKSGCNIPIPTQEGAVTQEPLGGTAGSTLVVGGRKGEDERIC